MAPHQRSDDACITALRAYLDNNENFVQGADSIGWDRMTFKRHVREAKARGLGPRHQPQPLSDVLPSNEEDAAELWAHLTKRSQKIKARWNAEKQRRIRIQTDEPFAITWFTDVHLGDPGTDYKTLDDHIKLTRDTPYAYAAFMGDASNNWPTDGRLARKWADQETSKDQERQLVEYFMKDTGLDWLFWVLGNHDVWGDGEAILRMMNADLIPMTDWRAAFTLQCANKREVVMDVAHNFKGHSQWNTMHAEGKEAQMGIGAHFYFSGHLHTAALHYEEYAKRGTTSWLMRCKATRKRMNTPSVGSLTTRRADMPASPSLTLRQPAQTRLFTPPSMLRTACNT